MAEPEIELRGGTHGPVVRVGDTVRRAPGVASKAIHALLRHLELVGFTGAPRCLGFDDQGREILTFIPGEVAVRGDGKPLPDYVRSDASLMKLGQLTCKFHDATVGFKVPPGAEWTVLEGAPSDGEVICHNDLGPGTQSSGVASPWRLSTGTGQRPPLVCGTSPTQSIALCRLCLTRSV